MPRSICSTSSCPAVTRAPTRRPFRVSSRFSIAVPLNTADWMRGKPSSGVESHWRIASSAEAISPTDSSCGVVCAFPTTKLPLSSTMKVSVIVPPASIAKTRGSCSPIPMGRQ